MLKAEEVEQTIANLCVLYEKATGKKATVLHCHPAAMWMFMQVLPRMDVTAPSSQFELTVMMERHLPLGVFYVSEG